MSIIFLAEAVKIIKFLLKLLPEIACKILFNDYIYF